jgi:ribosomal subunit interface protein
MKINVQKANAFVTPVLAAYVEEKLAPLAKFVKQFDETGEAAVWVELTRTTKHHKKGGEVYCAIADLRLPKKILRAEEYAEDIRVAIDHARDTLRLEIEKYRTKFMEPRRGAKKAAKRAK